MMEAEACPVGAATVSATGKPLVVWGASEGAFAALPWLALRLSPLRGAVGIGCWRFGTRCVEEGAVGTSRAFFHPLFFPGEIMLLHSPLLLAFPDAIANVLCTLVV